MRRVVAAELMDDPAVDAGELAGNFDDIERANRHFGGVAPVARAVFSRGAQSVLDVGCGSGDIGRALVREAERRHRKLHVVGLDRSDAVLAIARARTPEAAGLQFVRGDATALPFADGSFDIATCNLALHHFEVDKAAVVLRELRRVSRLTPLVCDLERSRLGYVAALLFARLLAKNRLTKYDGPLSVRRAYTKRELLAFAVTAGWRAPHAWRSPFFRVLIADRG